LQEGLGKSVKILNLFARTDTNIYNKFYHTNALQKNLKTIRGFTKSTDLVIRTKKLIKKSHETVPLTCLNWDACTYAHAELAFTSNNIQIYFSLTNQNKILKTFMPGTPRNTYKTK
jgi:hypothetical protein